MCQKKVALLLAAYVLNGTATAQPYTFTRLVDSNTPNPGGTGTFDNINAFWYPTISDGNVVFVGLSNTLSDGQGIYKHSNGVLSVVADNRTQVPNDTGTFRDFDVYPPDVSGMNSAFRGLGPTNSGVFARFADAPVSVIADLNTQVPNGGGDFRAFHTNVSVDGHDVVFMGSATSTSTAPGVYLSAAGALSRVADTATPIPGGDGAMFSQFLDWEARQGLVTFAGRNTAAQVAGIYRQQGDAFGTIVDRNTPVPDGRGAFSNFTQISIDGNDIVFQARNTNPEFEGLFRITQGTLHRVVDDSTVIPGTQGARFTSAGNAEIFGGTVVFTENDHGVWLESNGELTPIVVPGQIIDGFTVADARFWANGRDHNQIVVTIRFTDDVEFHPHQAIYLITIPGPGAGTAVGATFAFALARRSRT